MTKLKLFDTPPPSDAEDPFPPTEESLTGHPKTEARLCTVQAIYQHLLLEKPVKDIEGDFRAHELKPRQANKKLFSTLLESFSTHGETHLKKIEEHLNEKWTIERLPVLEKSLLLAALSELSACPQTPKAVVINEFINIAKGYLPPEAVAFVNGILDKILKAQK